MSLAGTASHDLPLQPNALTTLSVSVDQQLLCLLGRKSQIEEHVSTELGPVAQLGISSHINKTLTFATARTPLMRPASSPR